MTTLGFTAMGAVLQFDGVTVGEVESWDGGEDSLDSEDILTTDSTDYYADTLAKAFKSAESSYTCIMQPNNTTGNFALLKAKFDSRTKATLVLTYANGVILSKTALFSGLGNPGASDAAGISRFTCKFKGAGKMTYTGTAA